MVNANSPRVPLHSLAEIEDAHVAEQAWEPLVEVYLTRLESRYDAPERAELLRRIGNVFEHGLGDTTQALDAFVTALIEDPHDRELARELERLAHATGRWSDVTASFVAALQRESDPERQLRFCLLLAKWYGDDLGRPEHAQPYYVRILQLDANNIEAMRQLATLYGKAGNFAQMGATLTRALELVVIDADRKELLTDIGALLEQLGETDRALDYLKQAIVVDRGHLPALAHLARIYAARGATEELARVREAQAAASSDPAEVAAFKLELAALYESADPARAAKHCREIADADPSNAHALRGLVRAHEALADWPALAQSLEALLDVVPTGKERIEVLVALAAVYEEHFLKSNLAAIRLEQVLDIDPNDMGAYFELERLYRKARMLPELVATYERHIAATFEKKGKIPLYVEIARVHEDNDELAEAIEANQMIVVVDEANVPALESLARLHEKSGDVAQAMRFMKRVAQLAPAEKRADAFFKIGEVLHDKLANARAAREMYEQALDVDGAHAGALAALRQMAIDEGDFEKAARLLEVQQSHAPAARQRAKLLIELARLREDALGDHASAVLVWEEALAEDPESEAALPLAEEYVATQKWEKAEPLLDRLARKASAAGDREAALALSSKLGRVAAALGKSEKAARAYRAAIEIDPSDKAAQLGLADACFASGDHAAAHASYARALQLLDEDDRDERADAYYKLGCVKRELGRPKQAIGDFERALAIDGAHRPSLDALVALYVALRDWRSVAAYKRATVDAAIDDDERLTLLGEIADVWNEAGHPERAAEALEDARAIRPSAALLHRLLDAHQRAHDWPRTVETLRAIAESERDPARRAKLFFTIAQIHEDELRDEDAAVAAFDLTLDAKASHLEAFERINKILTARKDWKSLERAFRKMLRRLSVASESNADLELSLWHNLGLIYRDRLRDIPSAIESFKMATRFKPNDAVERQILAELYEATNEVDAAAGELTIVLRADPLRVDAYRSMCKLFLRSQSYDRAWCACAALGVLGKADAEERRFYEDFRPRTVPEAKSRLVNEHWMQLLTHKDCDLFIGKIMEMITPAAIVAKTNELRAKGRLPELQANKKHDPATSELPVAHVFGWAAQVLGITMPELYVREDVPGAFAAMPSSPPASVAGKTATRGLPALELAFAAGKHLTGYRGEHYIRNLFPTLAELKVLFFAAIAIARPGGSMPPELAGTVRATASELAKHMQPIQREGLRLVVERYLASGATADLRRWMQTTDVTAARAGLLLCGDLEVARRMIIAEGQLPGELSPQEKVKELLLFSVSEQYAELRRMLGIGVVVA
jgi:tetratricopeptide (TPR) repeat protein